MDPKARKRFSGKPLISVSMVNNPPAKRSPGGVPKAAEVTYSVVRSSPPKVQVVMLVAGISTIRSMGPSGATRTMQCPP